MGRIGNLDLLLIYSSDFSHSIMLDSRERDDGTNSLEAAASSSVDLTASSGSTCARLDEGGNMI